MKYPIVDGKWVPPIPDGPHCHLNPAALPRDRICRNAYCGFAFKPTHEIERVMPR